ncbi:MAG: right-handed parallel beta-helix repeat-containing protein [Rikenellaceae bacterium]
MKKTTYWILIATVAILATVGYYHKIKCNKKAQIEIRIAPVEGEDMTLALRKVAEQAAKYDDVTIILSEGVYSLSPELAYQQYLPITNHGNGSKRIALFFDTHKRVKIQGNGATLLFSGQMLPFLFERCQSVEVSNLTVDWATPYTFLGEVVAVDPKGEWREIKPRTANDGFSWQLKEGKIQFPNIDGFSYQYLGSTLAFDAETKRPIAGALDLHSDPQRVEKLPNGNLKIFERLRQMPPIGSLLSSKGDREHDRYAPAFDFKESQSIVLSDIAVHHALGMAFLFERSENITIQNSQVCLSEGSNRVISSTADASHFANCKGDILIEGCRFENMLDDGVNVHGTYVVVSDMVDNHTLRAELQHFEQLGFKFADAGDEIWFINAPSPQRSVKSATVKSVKYLNEKVMEITFDEPILDAVKEGDLLENKTWNPTFTMRGCTVQNHRARSIVLKTPLKTLIEDNYFSSMMSGVLFRGESKFWYESGAVEDVLIKGNTFHNAGDCGSTHAALYITPLLGDEFNEEETYDRNIRFEGNIIDSSNPRIVIADRVEGLIVANNKIIRNDDFQPLDADAPLFELKNCVNCKIENNQYSGLPLGRNSELKADAISQNTLLFKANIYNK